MRERLRRVLHSEVARVWVPVVALLIVVMVGMSVLLVRNHEESRAALEQRYALRTTLASRFVASYVSDFHERQVDEAELLLASRAVSPARFALASRSFGFDAAVLLDDRGRVLDTLPRDDALVGTRIAGRYAHLRSAVAGRTAVSNIVPSAVKGVAIVALAVPFETPFGRRVFSGGARIDHSPLAAFLADAYTAKGARAYLLDGTGKVIAEGHQGGRAHALPPKAKGAGGTVTFGGTSYRYASVPVPHTPWRLLALTPSQQLFQTISGARWQIPWLALVAFGLLAIAALALLRRLLRQKAELTHLATHDPLTGALNRRTLGRAYARLAGIAARAGSSVGVIAVDLDYFKAINDAKGHGAGDEVLQRFAATLAASVRPLDVVARVGGDEFVLLLSCVTRGEVVEVGERIRQTMIGPTSPLWPEGAPRINCSLGISIAEDGDTVEQALARADRALYASKGARLAPAQA